MVSNLDYTWAFPRNIDCPTLEERMQDMQAVTAALLQKSR